MRPNQLFEKTRRGEVVLGLCNAYPASGIIEGMAGGWDFVWIDAQHGQINYDSALHALQAADAMGLDSLMRVPGHEESILGIFADLAPSAIMVPMVNTAAQAKAIVQGLRFPPLGRRSYGGRRVIDLDGRDYIKNRELMVVVQIETFAAVDNAPAIINTEGIDALFFGPDDMRMSLGLTMNASVESNAQLSDALARTAEAAQAAKKVCATVVGNNEAASLCVKLGYQILVGGADIGFLRTAAAQRLAELRSITSSTPVATRGQSNAGVYG